MTYAVDFDGVLHTYDRGWQDGSIYGGWTENAVAGLSQLMHRAPVFILTSRSPRQVAHWIERSSGHAFECTTRRAPWKRFWDVEGLLLVTRTKLPATHYIDDRAVRHSDWAATLRELGIDPVWSSA